jgi:hypothetical protein
VESSRRGMAGKALQRRPHSPAAGRGRLQRQLCRAFMAGGNELTSSQVYDWAYARNRRRPNQCRRHSVRRILRQIAEPIGRAPTIGRPWLWRLKTPAADMSSAPSD